MESGQSEPKISTKDYWKQFTYAMLLHSSKIQVNELLTRQGNATQTLTEEEKLNLRICKASFIMAIGDPTMKELQARYPKEDIHENDLKWIRNSWQEIWMKTEVQNQKFVKVMQARKEISETMLQLWTRLSGLVAKCNIDSMEKAEIENALQVAGFTNGVGDIEIVKTIWEKKMSFADLNKMIKDNQEAKQILKQQQSSIQIKEEPIGQLRKSKRIDRRERLNKDTKETKKYCNRCGDKWTPEHMEMCPAKKKKCNYSKKSGHQQKVCKKKQKDESKQQGK